MEKSMMNSTSEESGWTLYLEDFLASQEKEKEEDGDQVSYSVLCGSSMVSDAASYAAWKSLSPLTAKMSSKKLSLKKSTGRKCLHDDSLEDTASSPANSPKVGESTHEGMDIPKEKKVIDNGEVREVKSDFGETNERTELKKRGLCLVPLSMLVDYLG